MKASEPLRWTKAQSKDQHFYFTSPSATCDGKYVLSISEGNNGVSINVIERISGEVICVANADTVMRSYVYANGAINGISKASPFLDDERNIVYWIQDGAIFCVCLNDLPTTKRKIYELPHGWWTAYTHVSRDGNYMCVTCTEPAAFDDADLTQHDQLKNVPPRMIEKELSTKILVICTESGDLVSSTEIPFWVTHVQFDPQGTGNILFNCEGTVGSRGLRDFPYWGRMWLLEKQGNWRRVMAQPVGDTVNHENWNDYGEIIFHGHVALNFFGKARVILSRILRKLGIISHCQLQNSRDHYIAKCDQLGEISWKIRVNFPVSHAVAIPGCNDEVLADSRDGNIYRIRCYSDGSYSQETLVKHGSSMIDQDCHPHPSMNRFGKSAFFSTDMLSACDVFEISLNR